MRTRSGSKLTRLGVPIPKESFQRNLKSPTLVEKYVQSYKEWNKANSEHTEAVDSYTNYKNSLRRTKPTLFQILAIHNKANNMINKQKTEQLKSKKFIKLRQQVKEKYRRGKK
tara:strand:- start:3932 stop:4270 length:339 start_codon:yes stop_codon:yes gene_type:complete